MILPIPMQSPGADIDDMAIAPDAFFISTWDDAATVTVGKGETTVHYNFRVVDGKLDVEKKIKN